MSREVELKANRLWSGRRGCQLLPATNDLAVCLDHGWLVCVPETAGRLEFGLGEGLLVAPTNVFVPASRAMNLSPLVHPC